MVYKWDYLLLLCLLVKFICESTKKARRSVFYGKTLKAMFINIINKDWYKNQPWKNGKWIAIKKQEKGGIFYFGE